MNESNSNRAAIAIAEKLGIKIDDSLELMKEKCIWVMVDDSILNDYQTQAAFLTVVNIASRVFHGGVYCSVPESVNSLLNMSEKDFTRLIRKFGGTIASSAPLPHDVKILIGLECFDENCIESTFNGWRGGVNFKDQVRVSVPGDRGKVCLGAIASASLACFHAFCRHYSIVDNYCALNTGISLWNLNSSDLWYCQVNEGPLSLNMPRRLWSLGLGHLGQAYLWSLGLMNFRNPSGTKILLQDDELVGVENLGSQVLSFSEHVGVSKTRVCMKFLEDIGFKTQIIEKRFYQEDLYQQWMDEYPILINGVDNLETRRAIKKDRLTLYLDGATNGAVSLFDSFTMKNPSKIALETNDIWPLVMTESKVLHKNLYDRYQKEHNCGYVAEISVSTPFVGVFGASMLIAELLRSLNEGKSFSALSVDMRDLKSLEVAECDLYNREYFRLAV